jgi:hypothetical protein
MEDANLFNAKAKLGLSQPAKALDSTLGDLGRFVPEMYFKRILDGGAPVRRERPIVHGGAWSQDDLETNLAIM